MIAITNNRGFHLTFENGITISIQIGSGNYSDNYDEEIGFERDSKLVKSSTAEIAIWDASNKWFLFDDENQVKGWVSTQDVGEWIERVRKAIDINSI